MTGLDGRETQLCGPAHTTAQGRVGKGLTKQKQPQRTGPGPVVSYFIEGKKASERKARPTWGERPGGVGDALTGVFLLVPYEYHYVRVEPVQYGELRTEIYDPSSV